MDRSISKSISLVHLDHEIELRFKEAYIKEQPDRTDAELDPLPDRTVICLSAKLGGFSWKITKSLTDYSQLATLLRTQAKLGKIENLPDFPQIGKDEEVTQTGERILIYMRGIADFSSIRDNTFFREFLMISNVSFINPIEEKSMEGYIEIRTRSNSKASRWSCGACGRRRVKKKWMFLKRDYVALMDKSHSAGPEEVFPFDFAFAILCGRLETGFSNKIKLSNSDSSLTFYLANELECELWGQAIIEMYSLSHWAGDQRYNSLYPIRFSDGCKVLIDAEEYYNELIITLKQARSSVMIADWFLTPELFLKRPAKFDDPGSQRMQLVELLGQLADRNVDISIFIYREFDMALPNNSMHAVAKLKARNKNIKVVTHPGQSILEGGPRVWSHHSKICVVDQETAFIGGIDLCYGRYDDHSHNIADETELDESSRFPGLDYYNIRVKELGSVKNFKRHNLNRKEVPRMPWHDIQIKIRGEAAYDVARHFMFLFNHALKEMVSNQQKRKKTKLSGLRALIGHDSRRGASAEDSLNSISVTTPQHSVMSQAQIVSPLRTLLRERREVSVENLIITPMNEKHIVESDDAASPWSPQAGIWKRQKSGAAKFIFPQGENLKSNRDSLESISPRAISASNSVKRNVYSLQPTEDEGNSDYLKPHSSRLRTPVPKSFREDIKEEDEEDEGVNNRSFHLRPMNGISMMADGSGEGDFDETRENQSGIEHSGLDSQRHYLSERSGPRRVSIGKSLNSFDRASDSEEELVPGSGADLNREDLAISTQAQDTTIDRHQSTAHEPELEIPRMGSLPATFNPFVRTDKKTRSEANQRASMNILLNSCLQELQIDDDDISNQIDLQRGNTEFEKSLRPTNSTSSVSSNSDNKGVFIFREYLFKDRSPREWIEHHENESHTSHADKMHQKMSLERRLAPEATLRGNASWKQGSCDVQIVISAAKWSLGLPSELSQNSIQNAYLHMIANAQHCIYIENQFFISSLGNKTGVNNLVAHMLAERILRAHANDQAFRVYIFLPLLPGFSGHVAGKEGGLLRYQLGLAHQTIWRSENSVYQHLVLRGMRPNEIKKYIAFYGLRQHGKIAGVPKTEMIYIHSKIMIIDDEIAIIGSANINERSMNGGRDSEICAVVHDKEIIDHEMNGERHLARRFAFDMRMRLMMEHTGLPRKDLLDPSSLTTFEQIKGRSQSNTLIYREIFRCYPDDMVQSLSQVKQFEAAKSLELYDEKKALIRGHIVDYPLDFLKNESLDIKLTDGLPFWLPNKSFV